MNITSVLFISLLACLLVKADMNACDDFYAFACEEFIRDTHIPDSRFVVDQIYLLEADAINKLRDVIAEEDPEDSDCDKLPKTFYNACLHYGESDLEELQELLEDLHGFPVNSEWDASSYDWIDALYKLNELGLSEDILFKTNYDTFNEEKASVSIEESSYRFFISNDTQGNSQTAAYYKYMVDAAELLGADRQTAEADMMDVLMFENEIEKIKHYRSYYNDTEQPFITFGNLSRMEPRFPWLEYFNRIILEPEYINETQHVVVYPQQYLINMMDLLQEIDTRTLANFMNWKIIDFAFDYLSDDLKELKPRFMKPIIHDHLGKSEERICLTSSFERFQDITGVLFLRKYFTNEDQQVVAEMVEGIKEEVKQIIVEVEWMDEETKEAVQRKLADLNVQVGYPEEWFDEDRIESRYEQLTLTPGSFLQVTMNTTKFFRSLLFSHAISQKIWKYEDSGLLEKTMLTRIYSQKEVNGLVIPAGFLQPPIFNRNSSDEVNYGSAGYAVGRGLIYQINDRATHQNDMGELTYLWTESTKKAYKNISQCDVEGGLREDFERRKDFALTDLTHVAAAKLAYRAYQKTTKQNQEEDSTAEGYSANQLFWLSMANYYCRKYRLPNGPNASWFDYERNVPINDAKEQMTDIVIDNEDFARDWNCESGSPINPKTKCQVW